MGRVADVNETGRARGHGDDLRPANTPARVDVTMDRVAAGLLALAALYVVFFGTSMNEWLWYALAAVIGSGYFLWRSLRR